MKLRPVQIEKRLLPLGLILILIIIVGSCQTSKLPWVFSEDLSDWKDSAEFAGLILGPYLALIGAYYVWKTLDMQTQTKLVDSYSIVFTRLERSIPRIDKKLKDLELEMRKPQVNRIPQNELWLKVLDCSNDLHLFLIEVIALKEDSEVKITWSEVEHIFFIVNRNFDNQLLRLFALNNVIDFNNPPAVFFPNLHGLLPHAMDLVMKWEQLNAQKSPSQK